MLATVFRVGGGRNISKGDIDINVEVDVHIDRYVGCLKRVSKSVQVLLNGTEAVLV